MNQTEVYLQSKYKTIAINGDDSNSDMIFYLMEPIIRPLGQDMRLRVSNFVFPISYYLVDYTNNELVIGSNTYTLTEGNYSATQLATHILTLLPNTYSMSYSSITNKFTITNSSANFTIKSDSTCLVLLGFTEDVNHTSSGYSLTSDAVVNLTGNNMIYVDIKNITTSNISSLTGRRTSIIKSIPVSSTLSSVMFFEDTSSVYSTVLDDTITYFHVRILAEDMESLVDFQSQDWNMTLEIAFTPSLNADKRSFAELVLGRVAAMNGVQSVAMNRAPEQGSDVSNRLQIERQNPINIPSGSQGAAITPS